MTDIEEEHDNLPYFLGVLIPGAVLVLSLYLTTKDTSFPSLEDGYYTGYISDDGRGVKYAFAVNVVNSEYSVFAGDLKRKINLVEVQKKSPLKFSAEDLNFNLAGQQSSDKKFEGADKRNQDITWQLNKEGNYLLADKTLRYEGLKSLEATGLNEKIAELSKTRLAMKIDNEKYSDLFAEGAISSDIAGKKLAAEQLEIAEIQEKTTKLRKDVSKTRARLALAKRATEEGQIIIATRRALKEEFKKLEKSLGGEV